MAVATVVIFFAFVAVRPSFLNTQFVILPMLRDAAVFSVVGLAQMAVLSVGHMNLAVGRMAAMGAMVTGATFQFLDFPFLLGVLVGVVGGGLLGFIAGMIIVTSNVNAFVVTLAMDFVLLGLVTMVYSNVTESGAFSATPPGMQAWRTGTFQDVCLFGYCGPDWIPVMVVPAIIAVVLVHHLFTRTRVGRETLATGSNPQAAILSGIPASRRIVGVHTLSGALAALGGIMLASTTGSFSSAIGTEFMIPSFLAPVLGGTLMSGGAVFVLGTVAGTFLTTVIRMGLSVMGAGLATLNIALGIVLLIALSTQRFKKRRMRRKRVGTPIAEDREAVVK